MLEIKGLDTQGDNNVILYAFRFLFLKNPKNDFLGRRNAFFNINLLETTLFFKLQS